MRFVNACLVNEILSSLGQHHATRTPLCSSLQEPIVDGERANWRCRSEVESLCDAGILSVNSSTAKAPLAPIGKAATICGS
jgi:hypothetical protein